MHRLLAAGCLLLLCRAVAAQPADPQIDSGLPVAPWHGSSLRQASVDGVVDEAVAKVIVATIEQRIDMLDAESIRTALAIAHSRLPEGSIEARVQPRGDGTADLRILVRPEPILAAVEVRGMPGDVDGWQAHVYPHSGERVIENRILRTVYELEEVVKDAGYLDAGVTLSVGSEGNRRVRVAFVVESGEQVTVAAVEAEPALPADSGERLPHFVNGAGKPFHRDKVREDSDRLRKHLVEGGYRQARVGEPVQQRDGASMRLVYPVTLGPLMSIEFDGFDVDRLRRKGRLPVLRDQGYDAALVPATQRELVDYMQSKGHYEAEAAVETIEGDGTTQVRFLLTAGDRFDVASVTFEGAGTFDRQRLQSLILTKQGRALVDSELEADLENLRSFYAVQGFAEVEVDAQVEAAGNQLAVSIQVAEGARSMVDTVEVLGVKQLDRDEIVANLPIEAGSPFHPTAVNAGAAELQRRYRQRGYRSSYVTSEVLPRVDDAHRFRVSYRVLEGRQVRVGEVFLRGLDRTRPGFVRKVLDDLQPDFILSSDAMVAAEGNLFQLGLFSDVDLRSSPSAPFTATEDLIVEVVEAPIHRLSYGLGWDSEDGLRGIVGYVRNNWLGRGLAWNLDASISSREALYRILLTQPWIGSHRTPITYSLFLLDEDRESFSLEQSGAQVGVRQQRGRTTSGLLFTWRQNETTEGAFSLDRDIAPVEIASITPSLFVDRRDDAFDPTTGWSGLVEIEEALSLFGADERFTKLFSQFTRYLDLGNAGVLAGAVRAGWIDPISSAADGPDQGLVPPGLKSSEVTISERLVSGGRSSHRAYGRFELGELGETLILCDDLPEDNRDCSPGEILPLGGAAMGIANLDWRFPVWGGLGGVVFADAGNVWGDWSHADNVKLGAGFGFRYSTPIGPMRLEIAWKLDREPFEDPYVIVLSVGNPF